MDRRYRSGIDIQLFVGVDQTLESSVNWTFGQPDPANVDKGPFAILQLENGVILTDLFLKKSRNVKIRDGRCQECLIGSIGIVMPKIYKGKSTLVPIVPKITARWRQMEFCIFCVKSRKNERSSVVCSLNINKLSRIFHDFFL